MILTEKVSLFQTADLLEKSYGDKHVMEQSILTVTQQTASIPNKSTLLLLKIKS